MTDSDVLIIGTGAAGMQLALRLAEHNHRVLMICKSSFQESSTYWAQGGIAAAWTEQDSPQQHIDDTLSAGIGLCNEEAVRFILTNARQAMQQIMELGFPVSLDGASGNPHLHREGGHSQRRILHSADRTGKALAETLYSRILSNPKISILQHHLAVNLIHHNARCYGAYVLNTETSKVAAFNARCTVLACGGAGRVYLYSTNPDGATGDGIALAYRAGCRIANMEFNQFHPTCLYHPQAKSFLLSEALRGEGARLLLPNDTQFMHQYDKRGDLAPRDITARAIDDQMKKNGLDHVLLDITHKPAKEIIKSFPHIYQNCLSFGLDLTKEPIPVVPAAHYMCGGIMTDLHGRTDLACLYAIGETAYTGLHGANRLASNSLLECLVMAQAASESIRQQLPEFPDPPGAAAWDESRVTDSDEEVIINHNWDELRRFMWNYVGIARTDKRLQRARHRITLLREEIKEYYAHYRVSRDLLELRNLALCAELITDAAIARKESRGLHYNSDHPNTDKQARISALQKSD